VRGDYKWVEIKYFPIEFVTMEVGICYGLFSRLQISYLDSSALAALFLMYLFFLASVLVSEVELTSPQKTFVNIVPYHLLCKQIQIKLLTKQSGHDFGIFLTSTGAGNMIVTTEPI